MGGKNRAKKLASTNGSATTKKSSSVKVGNKQSNKNKQRAGMKEEVARGKNVVEKKAVKAANKSEKQAARRSGEKGGVGDGQTAESRKKAKRSHGAKATGVPSVKQQKQHSHEPHAMARHDAAYNIRAQAKIDRLAGKLTPSEESDMLAAEAEQDPEANAADERFFAKHQGMAGFLDNLDADAIKWSKEDRNKVKPKFPQPAPGSKRPAAADSYEDMSGDDDDDDDDDDEEEDEDDSEDEAPKKAKAKPARGMAAHERGVRVPSWAVEGKEAKDRMPVRNADGTWGASEVTKYDTLRARAEKIEQMQKKQNGTPATEVEDDDEEMADAQQELNGDADASEDEQDEEEDEDDYFDDEIPNEDHEEEIEADLEMEEAAEQPIVDAVTTKHQQERRQYRLKSELAENSELILENPERNIGKLEPMLQLCTDVDLTIQQVAMMSCVEVLVDLMPAYRIRMPTDDEAQANLSKEVKATWKYERQYLLYYGRLVNLLITYIRRIFPAHTNDKLDISALGINLLRCASKLLEKGYSFNYRKELINALSPFLNHVSPRIRLLIFQTLVSIFRSDIAGESTLEIVRILARLIKEKGRRCQVELLQIFLYLPLHKDILEAKTDDAGAGKKKEAPSKKKKHIVVDEKELGRDLAESEATVSIATRKKIQTQLLTELFTSYFRILKQQKNSKLLPTVLKGLSKFATLIDIEIVLDLLDCLKATISPENEEPLSLESSLYCILTSFSTLHSHGQALTMDLKEFYNCLYTMLFKFCDATEVVHLPLLMQCLHLMFQETKQLSIERVASFVKRLSTLCLYVPPYAALSIMHAMRLCLNKYPKVKQLLDREATASGLHLAEMDDPDLANSFASTAWELGLLKSSYHPFIPVYASSILEDEALPLSLSRTAPQDLFENYDSSEGGFNPPLPLPIMFSSVIAAGATASTSMKKKLDLKRRILVQQLSAAQRNERFQSPFLRAAQEDSRKCREADAPKVKSPEVLQAQLTGLQAVAQRYQQHQKKKRASTSGKSAQAKEPQTKKQKR